MSKDGVASILKRLVSLSRYTQDELAQLFKISRPTLNEQLNGKKPIPVSRISELVKLLKPKHGDMILLNAELGEWKNVCVLDGGKIEQMSEHALQQCKKFARNVDLRLPSLFIPAETIKALPEICGYCPIYDEDGTQNELATSIIKLIHKLSPAQRANLISYIYKNYISKKA